MRNRASELVKLLGDVEMIRSERKKARANRNKFGGFEGGMSVGGGLSGSRNSRYGGFGSESLSFGGYSGGVYGDGGGFGGASSDFQDAGRRGGNQFDEYDEYDEADATPAPRRGPSPPRARAKQPEPPKPKEPEPDLLGGGDDDIPAPTSTAAGKQPATGGSSGLNVLEPKPADDDDFDDFQSATPAPAAPATTSSNRFSIPPPSSTGSTTSNTQFAAPKPVSGSQGANLNGIVGFTSMTPTPTSSTITSPTSPAATATSFQQQQKPLQPKPTGFQAATPNYFTSVAANTAQPAGGGALGHRQGMSSVSSLNSASSAGNKPAAAKSAGGSGGGSDVFGSLWSSASASAGIQKSNSTASKGPNLASMAKEKASAGIWGAPAAGSSPSPSLGQASQPRAQQGKSTGNSGFDDLLG